MDKPCVNCNKLFNHFTTLEISKFFFIKGESKFGLVKFHNEDQQTSAGFFEVEPVYKMGSTSSRHDPRVANCS